MRSTLVLGGARSGKTRRALAIGEGFAERYYIATAEALDVEMADRIARHKDERGGAWTTIEAPLDLAGAIRSVASREAVCVVDCLTLWLSNLFGAGRDVREATAELCRAVTASRPALVLVSNEIGLGLVPETPLGRAFRDEQGRLNQAVAEAVDSVELVVAGQVLRIKS
nr:MULTISPECIES: bifunctional adenosylcobinamide kinase/adenosylcobinamide-phosphate guanylyltransferase [Rhodomicrobium]